ncbi:MAG: PfkB family carbohydrate kinase, partial [Candidatus Omnitrophica bacterium]|nr:PfkB family carbohydrate kinase [Candidatus Omnitrophota bacterium]
GVINPYTISEVVKICKEKNKIVTVDPKEDHFDYYQGVTALTPNLKEAEISAGFRVKKKTEIELLGEVIMEKLKPRALIITLGEDGMQLFMDKKNSLHIPTTAKEVYDVTGAGDTVIAVFTLALASGGDFLESTVLSNFAAGIVVGKLGAATTYPDELWETVENLAPQLVINEGSKMSKKSTLV